MSSTVHTAARDRPPGRPRDPAVDQAIIAAATQVLAEAGFQAMSMEAVAQRAGVGKPAIYRRWASKQDLVLAILGGLADQLEMPTKGTARQRLTAFMQAWCRAAQDERAARLPSALLGEASRNRVLGEAVRKAFVDTRRQKVLAVLREAAAQGELRPGVDLELAADVLLGPLLMRRLITETRITPAVGRKLVDILFDAYASQERGDPLAPVAGDRPHLANAWALRRWRG
jgi:AcrR family transcriptional regulator